MQHHDKLAMKKMPKKVFLLIGTNDLAVADKGGNLKTEYTIEGLHLSIERNEV
jgi:lysophospholipase L1-like esterase